jgi:phage FluMu protein Com
MEQSTLKEYRCVNCNKLLFRGILFHASVEIKCRGCKSINTIEGLQCKLLMVMDREGCYKNSDGKPAKITGLIANNCDQCEQLGDCRYLRIMKRIIS